MKNLFAIILFLCFKNAFSQIYFDKQHDGDWYLNIEKIDQTYYCGYNDYTNASFHCGFCKVNIYGDTLQNVEIPLLADFYISAFDKISERVYFLGNHKLALDRIEKPVVVKTNYNGDTLRVKRFYTGILGHTTAMDIKVVNPNEILVTGTFKPDTITTGISNWNHDIILLRLDSNLNVVWFNIYGTSLLERPLGYRSSMLILNDGNILVNAEASLTGYLHDINNYKSVLIKFDNATGNVISTYTKASNNYAYGITCFEQLNDNSIMATAQRAWTDDGLNWPPDTSDYVGSTIIKLDSNFNQIWEKKYILESDYNQYFPKMFSDSLGYYFFFSNHTDNFNYPKKSNAYLIYTNFNGDSIGTMLIKTENYNNFIPTDWIQNENKSFVFCGFNQNYSDYTKQRWIMGLDSLSFTDSIVYNEPPEIDTTVAIVAPIIAYNLKEDLRALFAQLFDLDVFPNPASESITISTTDTIVQVQVFDVVGQRVFDRNYNTYLAKLIIDVTQIEQGNYYMVIYRKNFAPVRKKIIVVR